MNDKIKLLTIVLSILSLSACVPRDSSYLPTHRGLILESSETLGAGKSSLEVAGSVHQGDDTISKAINVGYSNGLSNRLDVDISLSLLQTNQRSFYRGDRYTARAGGKFQLNKYFSLKGGVEIGSGQLSGNTQGGDMSFVASVHQCWVTPTVAMTLLTNRTTEKNLADNNPDYLPNTTNGFSVSGNLKIPLSHHGCRRKSPVAIIFGAALTKLKSNIGSQVDGELKKEYGLTNFGAALETRF